MQRILQFIIIIVLLFFISFQVILIIDRSFYDIDYIFTQNNFLTKIFIKKSKPENFTHTSAKRISKNLYDDFAILVDDIKKYNGTYSIYIKDLTYNNSYLYNENEIYYAASLYKIPIGIAYIKQVELGNLSLNKKIKYQYKHATMGTGVINQSDVGTEYSIDELLKYLFKYSDNTAQEMLNDNISINSTIMKQTFPNNGNSDFYHNNNSSVKEIGDYISDIFANDYIDKNSKNYLLSLMSETEFDDYMADYINYPYANKIGTSGSSIHDCGIIYDKDIVLCVMSKNTNLDTFKNVSKRIAGFINKF